MAVRARIGVDLVVLKRPISFTFWPTGRDNRRAYIQSRIFVSNPWSIIRDEMEQCAHVDVKPLALALIRQGEDLFKASTNADVTASRPLLIYYSFMQLVKAFCLIRGTMIPNVKALHGIGESLTGPIEFLDSKLDWFVPIKKKGEYNVFSCFLQALKSNAPAPGSATLPEIFEQVLIGHRVFTQVAQTAERFVEIDEIVFLHDQATREIWPQIRVKHSELTRLGYPVRDMLSVPGMTLQWRQCQVNSGIAPFEANAALKYTSRPSDILLDAAKKVRPFVWSSVLAVPPFRKYYLYRATGVATILPQLASIYGAFYYLGSLTRYRPDHFQAILSSKYGASVTEFIENQPMQFLYLMASEIAEQEVTRAAIV